MHEHVSVSHEKDFTGFTDLMNYRFYSAKVDSSVKNQVLAVLYKQKNPYRYKFESSHMYVSDT